MLSSIQSTEIRRSLNKTIQHIAGFHIQKHFKTYQNFTMKNQGWIFTDCLISSTHGQKFYIQIDYSINRFSQKIALIISSTMSEKDCKVQLESIVLQKQYIIKCYEKDSSLKLPCLSQCQTTDLNQQYIYSS